MTNCYHSKSEAPKKPGNYWVHLTTARRLPDGTVALFHADGGYARWDGQQWDRDDWDCWYFEERSSAFPTGSVICSSR